MSFPRFSDLLPWHELGKPIRILLRGLFGDSADGLILENETKATEDDPVQVSPRLLFRGAAWGTDDEESKPVEISLEAVPIESADGAVKLVIAARVGDGDLTPLITLNIGDEFVTTTETQTLFSKTLDEPVILDSADFRSESILPIRMRAFDGQVPEISLEANGGTIADPDPSPDSSAAGHVKFKVRDSAGNLREVARISGILDGTNASLPPGKLVFYVRAPGSSVLQSYAELDDVAFNLFSPLALPQQSSAPSSPANGWAYYDTTLNKGRLYENGAWRDI
jgi:hypothetical protein